MSLRNPAPCALCGGTTFVRGTVLERSGDPPRLEPLAITFRRKTAYKSLFSLEEIQTRDADLDLPKGELEALFCRSCGKVDWFVKDPDEVPIGDEYGTELVEVEPGAPYR